MYILLSGRSQSEKATHYMILTIWHSFKVETMETLKKISGWQGLEATRKQNWNDKYLAINDNENIMFWYLWNVTKEYSEEI